MKFFNSFFGECFSMENKPMENIEQQIIDYMLRVGSLTTKECQQKFGTSELRHYISRIIKRGYNVQSKWVKYEILGKNKRVKLYWIEK